MKMPQDGAKRAQISTYVDNEVLERFRASLERSGLPQHIAVSDALRAYTPVLERLAKHREEMIEAIGN